MLSLQLEVSEFDTDTYFMNVEKWNTVETVTPLRTVGHVSIHRAYDVHLAKLYTPTYQRNIRGIVTVQ